MRRLSIVTLSALALPAGAAAILLARAAKKREGESLRDCTVLITGGSRGLGLILAREFAQEGSRIAICARDESELNVAKNDLEQRGAQVLALTCDVSNRTQIERMVSQTTQHFGRIDVLVNNAGIITVGPIQTMAQHDFEQAMNVMFWGPLWTTQAVLPQMLERKAGKIVNVTSIGGRISVPHLIPYCCAKFAAVALSEGLRAELNGEGISVTTVLPGLMRTGSHVNAVFKGRREAEFALFSLAATSPLTAMDAERAARKIVSATKTGEAEVVLGAAANFAIHFKAMFPDAMSQVLGMVNDVVLPAADGVTAQPLAGRDIQERANSGFLNLATQMGRSAVQRFQTLHHER